MKTLPVWLYLSLMNPVPARFKSFVEKHKIRYAGHYIPVPAAVAKQLSSTFPFRVLCTINGHTFHRAIVKQGEKGHVITVGRPDMKQACMLQGQEITVELRPDTSEYGYEVPEELLEVLRQDEAGRAAWEAWSPGQQRGALHYICSTKNPDLRIKRSLYMVAKAQQKK